VERSVRLFSCLAVAALILAPLSVFAQAGPPPEREGPPVGREAPPPPAPGRGERMPQQRGPGFGPDQARPMPREGLSEEMLLKQLAEINPAMAERFQKMRQEQPESFRREMPRISQGMRELMELKRNNPQEFEGRVKDFNLQTECEMLGDRIRSTSDENERKDLTKKLQENLKNLFDVRLERMKRDRDNMRRELERMEKTIAEREKNREDLIGKRLERMTGKGKMEEW